MDVPLEPVASPFATLDGVIRKTYIRNERENASSM